MKILFLCNKSPWPPKEGGPMAMNMLVEGLIGAGHSVKVLAVNSFKYNIHLDDIPIYYREQTSIELIHVDLKLRPWSGLFNLITGKSYHVQRFISARFKKRLEEILHQQDFDIVQMETLFMSPYIKTVRDHSGARIFLRAHNIEHRIWERVADDTKNPFRRWYIRHLAKTLKTYEQQVIPSFDGIVAITPTDAGYFKEVALKGQKTGPGKQGPIGNPDGPNPLKNRPFAKTATTETISPPVVDIPFGVDPSAYKVNQASMEFPSLFTLGAMNWIPNQEGVRWFLQNVWPDVHQEFPSLKYYLAGREMPAWMQNLSLEQVVVLGEVEDSRKFISSKAVMIVPLFSGSGIRIKIIEGMALGTTIISTTTGAEGIDYKKNENILIADSPCEFFEMISLVVRDRDLCLRIGKNARNQIETNYNSEILVQKLIAFYKQRAP